jgi:hypothetical protein
LAKRKTKTRTVYRTVRRSPRRRSSNGIFSGAGLTKGSLPRSLKPLNSIVNLVTAMVLGTLAGQGAVAILTRIGVPSPVPQVLGALTSFTTGGVAGAGGYILTTGALTSPESQASLGGA